MDADETALFASHLKIHRTPLTRVDGNRAATAAKHSTHHALLTARAVCERPEFTKSTSLAFRCLYTDSVTATVIRRHQQHVLGLIASKRFQQARQELNGIHRAIAGNGDREIPTWKNLLHGVRPDSPLPFQIVMAHHFLVLQVLLQHVAANEPGDISDSLLFQLESVFMDVATVFLSSSNFLCWLTRLMADREVHQKYLGNCEKMLGGFIKIASSLAAKHEFTYLESHRQILLMKLAEMKMLHGGAIDDDLQLPDETHAQFFEDLKLQLVACGKTKHPLFLLLARRLSEPTLSAPPSPHVQQAQHILDKLLGGASTLDCEAFAAEVNAISLSQEELLEFIGSVAPRVSRAILHKLLPRARRVLKKALLKMGRSYKLGMALVLSFQLEILSSETDSRHLSRLESQAGLVMENLMKMEEFQAVIDVAQMLLSRVPGEEIRAPTIAIIMLAIRNGASDDSILKALDPSTRRGLKGEFAQSGMDSLIVQKPPAAFNAKMGEECIHNLRQGIGGVLLNLERLDLTIASIFEKSSISESEGTAINQFASSLLDFGYAAFAAHVCLRAANIAFAVASSRTQCLLMLARARLVTEMDRVPETLKLASSAIKELKEDQIIHLVSWKLLQMSYIVQMGDSGQGETKLSEILKILKSRPEYDIMLQDSSLTPEQKFAVILQIAELLAITADLNERQGDFAVSLRNTKLAIKLLATASSKLLGSSLPSYLMDRTINLLSSALLKCIKRLYQIGLLKETLSCIKELTQLSKDVPPVTRALNMIGLAYWEKVGGNDCGSGADRAIARTAIALEGSRILGDLEMQLLSASQENQCGELRNPNYEPLSQAFLESWISDSTCELSVLQDFKRGRLDAVPRTLMGAKLKFEEVVTDSIAEDLTKVFVVPDCGFNIDRKVSVLAKATTEALLQCKQLLLGCADSQNMKFLSIDELRLAYRLLFRTAHLLFGTTVFKSEAIDELMGTLAYIHDVGRHLSYAHQIKTREFQSNDLMPAAISESSCFSLEDWKRGRQVIPSNWVVVSIDECNETGALILSKLESKMSSPVYLRIPKGEHAFENHRSSVEEILSQSKKSTQLDVTSRIKTSSDRREWWKNRFILDSELRQVMESLADNVLGAFQGFFTPWDASSPVFRGFEEELNRIWVKALSKHCSSFRLSDTLVNLFFHLDGDESNENRREVMVSRLVIYAIDVVHSLGYSNVKMNVPEVTRKICQLKTRRSTAKSHLVLLPGNSCSQIPWESMAFLRGRSISRMPSVAMMCNMIKTHDVFETPKEKLFYVVNPGGDLPRTQQRFESVFQNRPNSTGILGSEPSDEYMISNITSHDLFIYFGHGGGEQYLRCSSMQKAKGNLPPALLIGCSSGAQTSHGMLEPTSNIQNWLVCGSPMLVTNLWDVTDKDIDKFSIELLAQWGLLEDEMTGDLRNICDAVDKSRNSCTLRYLNGAAPIVHGLPLYIRK